MFLTISSTNFGCIWENQFSSFVYLLLDHITYTTQCGYQVSGLVFGKKMKGGKKIFYCNYSIYVVHFRKQWLRVKAINFDFIEKFSSTDYKESNKPNWKSLAYTGSKKSLVELGVPENKLSLFSYFSLY